MLEIFLSGIGNSRRDGGAANPVRTEHGDITAAASAIFASANANSWPIGEHHAYRMGSISRWRKGDKRGTFFGEMPGAAAEYAMGLIKKKLFGATPPAALAPPTATTCSAASPGPKPPPPAPAVKTAPPANPTNASSNPNCRITRRSPRIIVRRRRTGRHHKRRRVRRNPPRNVNLSWQ